MPDFIPGISLCRMFYREVVRPLLDESFPALPHSAALIGAGSEVLGFDTSLSTDHDWGPRLMLFLQDEDHERYQEAIQDLCDQRLPETFRGYPVRYSFGGAPVQHHVAVFTLRECFHELFGIDLNGELQPADWLTITAQELRTITAGAVYHDDIGLQALRERLAYYPHDIWLYLMAALWARIGQEEHLMGRAGMVGDELGAALIAARLVRDLMRLCFLLERQYAPYAKWFGTAFGQLACGPALTPLLRAVQAAATAPEREAYLVAAYEQIVALQNALGITAPLPTQSTLFFDRPYRVIHGGDIAIALREQITDPAVREIAGRRLIGSIEQFSDSTDLVAPIEWRPVLRQLYES